MSYTVRDVQARICALNNAPVIKVDGMNGPKTKEAASALMEERGVSTWKGLFGSNGLHRIHWHWTAGSYGPGREDIKHYNDLFDERGNHYDGAARAEHQANYDWRRGIGVSHTLNANTGAVGLAVTAMSGADGWPSLRWGSYPLTWAGIDAMLQRTADYCSEFDIPVTRWSTLSHAEVQPTLGIRQKNKWDFMVLPGMDEVMNAVLCGDILRKRLVDKFQ